MDYNPQRSEIATNEEGASKIAEEALHKISLTFNERELKKIKMVMSYYYEATDRRKIGKQLKEVLMGKIDSMAKEMAKEILGENYEKRGESGQSVFNQ